MTASRVRALNRRQQYETRGLDVADLDADPLAQFARWFDDAVEARLTEPNAMLLSTVGPNGAPSARVVLLRGMDERGFSFFTNYDSAKGRDLAANPRAGLTFSWLDLHRQVRIGGTVARLPEPESDAYFAGRPRESQLGAWASPQSEVLAGRDELDDRVAELTRRFAAAPVPRPPHWGGYVLAPTTIELWQGRSNRLHDRLRYRRTAEGWAIERLAP